MRQSTNSAILTRPWMHFNRATVRPREMVTVLTSLEWAPPGDIDFAISSVHLFPLDESYTAEDLSRFRMYANVDLCVGTTLVYSLPYRVMSWGVPGRPNYLETVNIQVLPGQLFQASLIWTVDDVVPENQMQLLFVASGQLVRHPHPRSYR